jgi:hypothetical protein
MALLPGPGSPKSRLAPYVGERGESNAQKPVIEINKFVWERQKSIKITRSFLLLKIGFIKNT